MGLPSVFGPTTEVALSNELMRIVQMPRRVLAEDEELAALARELTDILKLPNGAMTLRPLQAAALMELGMHRGLFGPLRVGSGKTLLGFLAPLVCFAQRPLLVIPADLIEKTERDRRFLSQHWDMPKFLRVMTYEWLGRKQAADALEEYQPDFCVYDEAHKLRNTGAAVTRRVRRYHSEHPETIVAIMSGTLLKRSLLDIWHLIRWSLGPDRMFLPRSFLDVEQWAQALDVIKGETKRTYPGALKVLCNEEELVRWETDPLGAARTALRRRMIETPGVVASGETEVDATLTVHSVECRVSGAVEEAFATLRTRWELPDGRIVLPEGRKIKSGLGMYQHARELALEFYYFWDPQPPRYWMDARKNWYKFVRKILSHSRTLDSESQVRAAHADNPALLEWLRVQDDYEPRTVAEWIGDSVLEYCAAWAERRKGIIWTEHVAFGERLARESGLTYYGKKGFSASGAYIEDHPPDRPLIAGFQSNHRGKCLEKWSTNLVTSCPANGLQMEQLIGRTHREGQDADEVVFDVLSLCAEHVGAFWQAHNDAQMVQDSMASQKLLLAGLNVTTPDELAQRRGPRWRKDWAGSLTAA